MQSKLEQIAIAQRGVLIPFNNYNSTADANNYSSTHTRALSDNETPVNGKGTGVFLDTENGGGSLDIYGIPNAMGSGRVGNVVFNQYNKNERYQNPDTSGNVGMVVI